MSSGSCSKKNKGLKRELSHLAIEEILSSVGSPHQVTRASLKTRNSIADSMLRDLVPSLHPLRFKDLPHANLGKVEDFIEYFEVAGKVRTASGIIRSTISHLEHSSLAQLQQRHQVPFFSIGPMHKMAPSSSTSLLIEDAYCIEWLDKQAPLSVIYVSLGSLATVDEKELAEMAWGLASSGQPFLWVVRPGSVRNSDWIELLPDGFKEETGERGRVVRWAPQKEVLAHCAVGGFWTHCGWNSTLESLSEGVPMLCMPRFGDQEVNARYICHVWRIGLECEHQPEVERGEIEKVVKVLMLGNDGEEMRRRATLTKEKVALGVRKGCSSYNSLNDLTEFLSL
ncbi:hypothetical protein RJ640_015320 [Escallonia rubra]|uniref:Uncharacterized protein n=1 Tax=Escallonia rubra TaxID=112253 RepID=A0AA88QRJ5_9ASTE|nr:hypothetical protein RJ640_015320 [Escallonia rubra]